MNTQIPAEMPTEKYISLLLKRLAEKEERVKQLEDSLKLIRKECPDGSWFSKTIDKALSPNNKTKEDE